MRNARVLRLSRNRPLCVFCATRQLATADPSPALSQRRAISHSNKAHQSASDQLFKDERQLRRSWNQEEPGQRASFDRRPQRSWFDQPAQNSRNNGNGLVRRTQSKIDVSEGGAPRKGRYNVNMDSQPQVNTPAFDMGHLRKRNDSARSSPAPPPRTWNHRDAQAAPREPPRSQRLDQDELDQWLGNNSRRRDPPRHVRLSRETNTKSKCWHCGSEGHLSFNCPSKPTLREAPPVSDVSLGDAAEKWSQQNRFASESSTSQTFYDRERIGRDAAKDRRRSRFMMDDEQPEESRNLYEEPRRRRGGVAAARSRGRMMEEEDEEFDSKAARAERKRQRKAAKEAKKIAKAEPKPIALPYYVSVAHLATLLKQPVGNFVRKLEDLGFEEVQNDHILNAEHAGLVAQEYGYEPTIQGEEEDGDLYPAPALSPEEYAELPARPPVVTIMGHVDHGKTTILDYMRHTSVAATEFGGITQHIGAFSVPLAHGKKITFLDTPGHSAFETMRARGANVTDIVVLVVAADDSVMPQTVEAIKHAHAAQVPLIVAINKIDKQQADPDRVKLDLGKHGIEVEDFGGDVQVVSVSGKTGQGIPELEEAISTLSETLDHREDPAANVEGWILEGTTKKSGRVATVLVKRGTLRQGDVLVAGTTWARVRSLRNEAGVMVKEIGPGMPVEVDGWREQPIAGDQVLQAATEQVATSVSELRVEKVEREQMAKDMEVINEARRLEAERREAEEAAERAAANGDEAPEEASANEKGPEVISFIVKADVSGSAEAVVDSIVSLGNGEVGARILRHGVGPPSEFDVQHAADAGGCIVNFNTLVPPAIASLAEEKGVKILDSNIIYRVVEIVKELMSEKLPPRVIQKVTGEVDIAKVFQIGLGGKKKMKVAGSKVRNGVVERGTKARVFRGEEVVFDGTIASLKNVKKDVDVMRKDTECGIGFAGWEDFVEGDKIQCYEEKREKRYL